MKTLKDTKITIRQQTEAYQDDIGAWHTDGTVDTVVWANCRGVKHSSYVSAHAEMEQPSMVATFELPRGMDLNTHDQVLAMGHVFEITHIDYLDMRRDVKVYCRDLRHQE